MGSAFAGGGGGNDNGEGWVVVGLHLAGPNAGEVIQGFAMAQRSHRVLREAADGSGLVWSGGLRKRALDDCIGIHPTMAEGLVQVRCDLGCMLSLSLVVSHCLRL